MKDKKKDFQQQSGNFEIEEDTKENELNLLEKLKNDLENINNKITLWNILNNMNDFNKLLINLNFEIDKLQKNNWNIFKFNNNKIKIKKLKSQKKEILNLYIYNKETYKDLITEQKEIINNLIICFNKLLQLSKITKLPNLLKAKSIISINEDINSINLQNQPSTSRYQPKSPKM